MHQIAHRYAGEDSGFRHRPRRDHAEPPGELTEALSLARAGDDNAVAYIYRRFSGNVYSFIRSMIHDDHDAEDLTQQVFAKVIPALATYEQRGVPFSAYLMRVARNLTIDYARRRVQFLAREERDEGAYEPVDHELSTALIAAIRSLPTAQRQVIVMRHIRGLAPEEIASALGTTESAVNALGHRGRRALQVTLTRSGAVPSISPTACAA
jgi:RNA polymerase sigma-70 factor (ECF subfamily)